MHKIQLQKEKKPAINNSRTRATKAQVEEDHKKGNSEIRKRVKLDKQIHINRLAEEAEQAADSRNMRQLYDTTRKLVGKYSKPE